MATKYASIRVEGGFLAGDVLASIADGTASGQAPRDFGFTDKTSLLDQISAAWSDARSFWPGFERRVAQLKDGETGTTFTRNQWVVPLLGVLGFEHITLQEKAAEVDGASYAISHRAGTEPDSPPIHIVGAGQSLNERPSSGRPRLAPHSLVQEYINRTEHLWGMATNGLTLRLMRDSQLIRRQAYLEVDLRTMFAGEGRFADFALLYRLIHRSRLPQRDTDGKSCLLERWFQHTVEQGGRIREKLREGVETAIPLIANGILRHPQNTAVIEQVRSGELKATELYQELLRLIYRLLFLMVTEERNLLTPNAVYRDRYSLSRLRRLCESRQARNGYADLWYALQSTFRLFHVEELGRVLQVPPLNGDLFDLTRTQHLNVTALANRDFLDALWYLCLYREDAAAPPRHVNYAALDVEELGSVYESLLDLQPTFGAQDGVLRFVLIEGTERKSTGSYYTSPELVDELITTALVPVVNKRLDAVSTKERETALLNVTVCDPACGSGHFLLAAARYLAHRLAKLRSGEDEPSPPQYRTALRDVIAKCIYGVDLNPLAVELCRVALWLESHSEEKPLSFLDHRIVVGNSLVGITDVRTLVSGIPEDAYRPAASDDRSVAKDIKKRNRRQLQTQQRLLHFAGLVDIEGLGRERTAIESIPDNTPDQIRQKKNLFDRFRRSTEYGRDRQAADLWILSFFTPLTVDNLAHGIPVTDDVRTALEGRCSDPQLYADATASAVQMAVFHWPIEFPEVLQRGGFAVILGNPPFLGGLKINSTLSDKHGNYFACEYAPFPGRADLCAAFYRRAFDLVASEGRVGMVATNSIGQGETREGGLAVIAANGGAIVHARRFIKWPGDASVEVNLVTIQKTDDASSRVLDGAAVEFISSRLDAEPEQEPATLAENAGLSFQGSIVLGAGFLLPPEEAEELIAHTPRNAECLFPYLTGEDLNSNSGLQPSRWVIQFDERNETAASQYPDLWQIVVERVQSERLTKDAKKYPRMVYEWWKHWNNRRELYEKARRLERVLVRSRISETHAVAFVPSSYIFSEQVIVFAFDDYAHFALLQSALHEEWARRNSSTLRTDVRYTPTSCFETFPFPIDLAVHSTRLQTAGQLYYEQRRGIQNERRLGLTKLYGLLNSRECRDKDIATLRELRVALDRAVFESYGWHDIALDHTFTETERGVAKFTVSRSAAKAVVRRLLALNLSRATAGGHSHV